MESPRQAPGILLHRLLEVLHRGATKGVGGGGGSGGGGSGGAVMAAATRRAVGSDECPPGVVEDLLAMMEQLGQDVAKTAEIDVETQGDGAEGREADAASSPGATDRQAEDGSSMDVEGDAVGRGSGREEGGTEGEGREQESESTKHVSFLFEALEVKLFFYFFCFVARTRSFLF